MQVENQIRVSSEQELDKDARCLPCCSQYNAKMMMKEALENVEEGIRVGGELIKDVKYADDQGMVANTKAGLQSLMDSLNTTAKHYDKKINIKKTKAMVVSRNGGERVNTTVEGQSVEQVSKFRYLGSLISEDGRCLDDVKTRIGMAKDAFNKRKELLTRNMRVHLRKRLVVAGSSIWM